MTEELFFVGLRFTFHAINLILCHDMFASQIILFFLFGYCRMYCYVVYMHEERLLMATLITQGKCLTWHCYL